MPAQRKKERRRRAAQEDDETLERPESEPWIAPETKRGVFVVFLFATALLSLFALFGGAGRFGDWLATILGLSIGITRYIFPFVLLIFGYIFLYPERYTVRWIHILGFVLLVGSLQGLLHLAVAGDAPGYALAAAQQGGGYIGWMATAPLLPAAGFPATVTILFALFAAAFLLTFETSLSRLFDHWRATRGAVRSVTDRFRFRNPAAANENEDGHEGIIGFAERTIGNNAPTRRASTDADEEEGDEDDAEEPETEEEEPAAPAPARRAVARSKETLRPADLKLDFLDDATSKPASGDIEAQKATIEQTLANFNIKVEMGDVSVGPTVTQYTFKPSEGVRLSVITSLHNDLALALAAHPIRIEAPIPGKSLVGIEVPNERVAVVRLRELLASETFKSRPHNLMIALGKDVAGKPWFADLTRMPHLLVAGSTGSGKSVCLNTIILSLLYQNGPDHCKFIFVDPKRVELTVYDGIPHLLAPVVTDVKKTVNALQWLLGEMDRRFELLQRAKKRDIATYNRDADDYMPYIVLIIDELADLMVAAASDVEGAIIRLAQMARAVGIHIIVATQRPSVDVITGLIKANITARIAFAVASQMDSRTILDTGGAERLVGRGDMLFTSAELGKPKRLQGAFTSENDILHVVGHFAGQARAEYDETILEPRSSGGSGSGFSGDESGGSDDPMIPEAKRVILEAGKASASLLQRRLRVGYARAARLLDLLEEEGFIGPGEGAKPREILSREMSHGTLASVDNGSDAPEESASSDDEADDVGTEDDDMEMSETDDASDDPAALDETDDKSPT